jgi:hypothetical protein
MTPSGYLVRAEFDIARNNPCHQLSYLGVMTAIFVALNVAFSVAKNDCMCCNPNKILVMWHV